MPDFNVIGRYLRQRRREAGLKQATVAKRLGYRSAQFISNCERGLCSLPTDKLRLLIDIYNIPAEELVDVLLEQQREALEKVLLSPRPHESKQRKEKNLR